MANKTNLERIKFKRIIKILILFSIHEFKSIILSILINKVQIYDLKNKGMATSVVKYLGELRTECTHLKSGKIIITDAPTDNNGKGEAFSPTDLVATAYASCILTVIGIYCEKHDVKFVIAEASVNKVMGANPRKIDRIELVIDMSESNFDEKLHQRIIKVAETCPVANTIGDGIELITEYKF